MKLFKKLFAEKLLRFYEGTNAGIRYISSAPVLKKRKHLQKVQGQDWQLE